MINPCFLKQTKDRYFAYSRTNGKVFSCIGSFPRYSESKCLHRNYISDYESHSQMTANIVIVNNLSFFNIGKYNITTKYEVYFDRYNSD